MIASLRKSILFLAILAVPALLVATLSSAFTDGEDDTIQDQREDYRRSARIIAQGLPQAHLTHKKLSDAIGRKALENYLDALDHDRTFFLASDIEEFQQEADFLDNALKRGDTDFAFHVFERFKERVSNRVAYVLEVLDQGFDFTSSETYTLDRKDASWPADTDEWDSLWRRKIKHNLLSRMIAQEIDEEFPDEETGEDKDEYIPEVKPPKEDVADQYTQLLNVTEGHDDEFVLQTFLNSFTRAYDIHSAFLSPRANEDFAINMKLSLTGIGALLTLEEGSAEIVRLIKGGPAEQDGRLSPGDRIVAVAQEGEEPVDILNWPLYKSVRLIRGEIGTTVTLTVFPVEDRSGATRKKIQLVRDEIKLEEREAKSEIRSVPESSGEGQAKIGVITLPEFYADMNSNGNGDKPPKRSASDIRRLLEELQEEGVNGIVLDLRNNGGGSLSDAIEMTGYFIDSGPVVQVKANRRVQVKRDPNPGTVYDGPLVILVNRQSASASEILSGALQDYGRAIIVGDTKTHGKGSVQSVFPLDPRAPELGALKITTAGFYRIDGRSTQLEGIRPDIVVPSAMDVMEVGEEFLPNVLPWSWVAAANYEPIRETGNLVETLKTQSTERLATNESYTAYQKLMKRLEEKISTQEISLNYGERKEIARQDRELQKMQEELQMSMTGADEEDTDKEDIILQEAIFILRDMLELPVHS